ncbi:MAG: type II secretion system minor pseudopilin GspI [Pseudohongiella sp.]|nr:type II secretion system minor pseudopilin GspI [Pseudohongiella sp.]
MQHADKHAQAITRGFTLVEVLVALAIVSVALLAALRTAGLGTTQSIEHRSRLLAGWVAEDRLAEHRALAAWLPSGITRGTQLQAGHTFYWREEVIASPNPAFRQLDIFVFAGPEEDQILARFTGFSVNPPVSN